MTVTRRFRRHWPHTRFGKGRLGASLEINVRRRYSITGEEAFGKLTANGSRIALGKGHFGNVEPSRVNIILHVPLLEIHLDGRMAQFVDHLHGESGLQIVTGSQAR